MSSKHSVDASENTTPENRPPDPDPDPDPEAADTVGFLGPRSESSDQQPSWLFKAVFKDPTGASRERLSPAESDALFAAVFKDPTAAAILLIALLPSQISTQLDLNSLEPVPAGVVLDECESCEGDLLFRARMIDGVRASVRIHYTTRASFVRVVAVQTGNDVEQNPSPLDPSLKPRTYESGYEKGRERGVETGVEKGKRALLLRLLGRRFGALPDALAQRVADASTGSIDHWFDRAVDGASLDGVFAVP